MESSVCVKFVEIMSARILRGVELQPNSDNELTLGEFFFDRAEEHGPKICQIDADLDQSETYHSVKQRSTRLAISLQKKGIDSGDVICLCCGNSLDNMIPILSALYLGAKVVSLDPSLSVRSTQHLLTLVTPKMIFVDQESLPLIVNCLNDLKLNCEIVVFGKTFSGLIVPSRDEEAFRPVPVNIHDTALMFFSSGTTGLPKAICHSHYSFMNVIEIGRRCGFKSERILHFTTFYWISGIFTLSRAFRDGTTRVFGRTMTGESTFRMIEKYKLTSIFIAPIYTYELTDVPNPERFDVSSFTCLLTGGTPISADQYHKLKHLFPRADIVVGYGMSEIGMITIFREQTDRLLMDEKIGSCGKAAPGTVIKVVNTDTGELLGPNQKGEIHVKSPSLMTGYHGTDSTSCFDSQGFLKTGDVGYYDDDDCFYVVERLKEMFKYKSWHIVPSSIEAVLLEHPCIKETVVFGIPRGEEGEIPAACVVLRENCDPGKDDIERFVAERVSDRERLRGGVIFVQSLPKTPTGKLCRNEARNIVIKSM